MIVTIWTKDLEIKVAFGDGKHLMTKQCNSKEEFDTIWNTVEAICHSLGATIELK